MKKLLLLSFLFLFAIKGFSQEKAKSDSIDIDGVSLNVNYSENDIYSAGIRFVLDKSIIDVGFGNTIKSTEKINNGSPNINTYRFGLGRKVSDDFSVGIDYVYTKKFINSLLVDDRSNIGIFLTYRVYKFIDLNFMTNNCTGNSLGVSFNLF